MNDLLRNLLLGAGLGVALGLLGRRIRFLSLGGLFGVTLASAGVFAAAGWVWATPMLVFLISMMLLARYRAPIGRCPIDLPRVGTPINPHSGPLGLGNALALAYGRLYRNDELLVAYVGPSQRLRPMDGPLNWACSARNPEDHHQRATDHRRYRRAISVLGLVAALGASWLIGFVSLLAANAAAWLDETELARPLLWLPLAALLGGMAGTLVDSLLGATAQAIYWCEKCEHYTEHRVCSCGGASRQVRGWSWLTNDGINLIGSIIGAAVAAGAAAWLARS